MKKLYYQPVLLLACCIICVVYLIRPIDRASSNRVCPPPPTPVSQNATPRVNYAVGYIKTLWDSKVRPSDEYLQRSEHFRELYRENGVENFNEYADFPRVMAILDFIIWMKKHSLSHPKRLLSTCVEDPEMTLLHPETVVEYRFDAGGVMNGDLHLLDSADIGVDFDMALFAQTLEHLWDPLLSVKNLFGKLRYGGYIFTSVPTLNIQHMTPNHYQHFTPMGLAMLFINAGFEVVEIGQWGNLDYEVKLLRTLQWPKWSDLDQPVVNQREHPCACWILARKPEPHSSTL